MDTEAVALRKSQPLAETYIHAFAKVRGLYEYDPRDRELWAKRAQWADGADRPQADRQALVRMLRLYNERLGGSPETMANIERLAQPETLVVVGGQQAGLFTGPLLVVYKAITIIQAARAAERELGRPVVPVFWIAGEDHDLDEVNHTYALTPGLEVERIRIELPTSVRTSMSRLAVEDWGTAIAQLDETLQATEFKEELLERLHLFAAESRTLVDLFGKLMTWLFGRYGLVLLDSDDPGVRALEGPMFRTLLQEHDRLHREYVQSRDEMKALGFEPTADVPERGVNLFVFAEDGERVLLQPGAGGAFTDRRGQRAFEQARLLDWCESSPERFSNNVLTRPLMQDYLLPVLAVVLGPGEIAYWGLTKRAFAALGMQMPPLLARSEHTLVEGTVAKNMKKYGLSFTDVIESFEERKNNWLREQDTLRLDERFAEVKSAFREQYEPLIALLSGINPGMEKLGQTNMQKIVEQIDFLHARAADANKNQFDGALRQWERIRLSLAPQGKLQERVYNVFAYLNRYGSAWIDELAQNEFTQDGLHRVVYLPHRKV